MGIFGDLDVASASDNPFAIPDNTYECYLTEVAVRPTKDGSKVGLNLTYRIASGDKEDRRIKEWKHIPAGSDLTSTDSEVKAAAERALSFLKMRLKELGVPAEKMNDLQPDDLIGKHVNVSVKTIDGFVNVQRVALAVEGNAAESGGLFR